MRRALFLILPSAVLPFVAVLLLSATLYSPRPHPIDEGKTAYLGFDRNEYPGDEALPLLHKTFSFASYWIGPPPGEKQSTWKGKRSLLEDQGFGFVVLFTARDSKTLKNASDARQKGIVDGEMAAKSAAQEGFSKGTIIFLDIEEGGRLPETYHEYLHYWFAGLARAGYRAGVYCSAIPVKEGHGVNITTAQDIQDRAAPREISFWVYNDACPPSPGCTFSTEAPTPSQSGFSSASVWQYTRSPRIKELTAHCAAKYAPDGNCYAPGDVAHKWFLDANIASSRDPSAPK
jgi:hypothetical protein